MRKLKNKFTHAQIAISIICFIVGLVIALQIKSVLFIYKTDPTDSQRLDAMTQNWAAEVARSYQMAEKNRELQDQLEEYQDATAEQSDLSKVMAEQLAKAQIVSGSLPVHGEGIIMTIDDSKQAVDGTNPAAFLIHQEDLLMIVNELKNAGAECLSLNDERLISTSDIRCVGSVVHVNGVPKAAPYVIKAIGSSAGLNSALTMRGGIVDTLSVYGIQVSIEQLADVKIPAYEGRLEFKFAKEDK